MSIQVLYRLSDKGRPKEKLAKATKKECLENAIGIFGFENIILFADNCEEDTLEMIRSCGIVPQIINLGNSASFRHVAQYAIDHYNDSQIVYLLEDDYLHLSDSAICVEEGLQIADYVTLYDHPDKYVDAKNGGNPLVKNGGELTRVVLTKSTHWKRTNSTTMTFACKVKTLRNDFNIWLKHTSGVTPKDFKAFKRLLGIGGLFNMLFGKGRVLISPIPSRSTHAEIAFLAPLVDWSKFDSMS